MSFAPTASTIINPHVKTMVPLSLRNPCCQKIIWSGLRRMTGLRCSRVMIFDRRAGQPGHDETCDDKSEQTGQQPPPIAAAEKVKAGERDDHAQKHAAEKPEHGLPGRKALAHGPPKAAEESRAEAKAAGACEQHRQWVIHR